MKKIFALILALVMIFALTACGKKAETEAEPTFPFDNDSTPFDVSTLTADDVAKIKVGFIFLYLRPQLHERCPRSLRGPRHGRGRGLHHQDQHPRGPGVL